MKLFTIVKVKKTNGYDVNVRRDGGNYIEYFAGVPTDVVEKIIFPQDLEYMLERSQPYKDLDECGYFALRECDYKTFRQNCKGYRSAKYPETYVRYEDE